MNKTSVKYLLLFVTAILFSWGSWHGINWYAAGKVEQTSLIEFSYEEDFLYCHKWRPELLNPNYKISVYRNDQLNGLRWTITYNLANFPHTGELSFNQLKKYKLDRHAAALIISQQDNASYASESLYDYAFSDESGNVRILHLFLSDNYQYSKSLLESGYYPQEDIERSFIYFIRQGNLPVVKAYVDHGVNINCDLNGQSPLHYSVHFKYLHILNYLISTGANLNIANFDGSPPLHLAVKKNFQFVKCLLDAGADVNMASNRGYTAMHIATDRGDWDIVELLLKHGADSHALSDYKESCLHIAALRGFDHLLKHYIQLGLDVNQANADGLSPLALASYKKTVKLLLSNGANSKDWNALSRAVTSNNHEVLSLLLNAGADELLSVKNENSLALLFVASAQENSMLSDLHKAGLDLFQVNNNNETALHAAAKAKSKKSVTFLLEQGLDPTVKNKQGLTAKELAGSGHLQSLFK